MSHDDLLSTLLAAFLGLHFSNFEQRVLTALGTFVPLSTVLTYEDKTKELIFVKADRVLWKSTQPVIVS